MERITTDEIKKAMSVLGKIKGASFKGEMEYILEKKGREGLKILEKETEKLGYLIEHEKIKETEWYPVGLRIVSFAAMINVFDWGEKELAEIAESSPKVSFIIRFFMKHFISPPKIFRVAVPKMWERHFNIGSLETADFQMTKKDGYAVIRLKNFKLHPVYCFFFGHYLIGTFKLTDQRFKEIAFEETKCMFKGDDYHEYLIKWIYK